MPNLNRRPMSREEAKSILLHFAKNNEDEFNELGTLSAAIFAYLGQENNYSTTEKHNNANDEFCLVNEDFFKYLEEDNLDKDLFVNIHGVIFPLYVDMIHIDDPIKHIRTYHCHYNKGNKFFPYEFSNQDMSGILTNCTL